MRNLPDCKLGGLARGMASSRFSDSGIVEKRHSMEVAPCGASTDEPKHAAFDLHRQLLSVARRLRRTTSCRCRTPPALRRHGRPDRWEGDGENLRRTRVAVSETQPMGTCSTSATLRFVRDAWSCAARAAQVAVGTSLPRLGRSMVVYMGEEGGVLAST